MSKALVRGSMSLPLLSFDHFDQLFREMLPSMDHQFCSEKFPKVLQEVRPEGLVYQIALAGYPEEKLHVEAGDGYIVVKGDKLEEEGLLHAGRAFTWSRRDPGGTWDFKAAKVTYRNGLLTIVIPERQEAKPKALQIEIK